METLILTNTKRYMGDLLFSNDSTQAKIDLYTKTFITTTNDVQTIAAITKVTRIQVDIYTIATAAKTYKIVPSYARGDYGLYFTWMEQIMLAFNPRPPRVVQNPQGDMLRF